MASFSINLMRVSADKDLKVFKQKDANATITVPFVVYRNFCSTFGVEKKQVAARSFDLSTPDLITDMRSLLDPSICKPSTVKLTILTLDKAIELHKDDDLVKKFVARHFPSKVAPAPAPIKTYKASVSKPVKRQLEEDNNKNIVDAEIVMTKMLKTVEERVTKIVEKETKALVSRIDKMMDGMWDIVVDASKEPIRSKFVAENEAQWKHEHTEHNKADWEREGRLEYMARLSEAAAKIGKK